MEIRRLLFIPAFIGALALGACAGEEGLEEEGLGAEEGVGVVDEGLGEAEGVVEEGVGVVEEGAVGATEILGNGIDDDGDGLIDEES